MCIIISAYSLHVYFTTFDMILNHILKKHVKAAPFIEADSEYNILLTSIAVVTCL